jgi:hypothetical protein
MGERTCIVDGCDKDLVARGWCSRHYQIWKRTGGPALKPITELLPSERFWPKVDAEGDCWIWMAGKTTDGYGRFRVSPTLRVLAHRWSYETLVGPIPAGMQIDHLCKNPPCVNPDHLEPVAGAENARRSSVGWNSRIKTHCPQGHPYAGRNLLRRNGRRICRACRRRKASKIAQT